MDKYFSAKALSLPHIFPKTKKKNVNQVSFSRESSKTFIK